MKQNRIRSNHREVGMVEVLAITQNKPVGRFQDVLEQHVAKLDAAHEAATAAAPPFDDSEILGLLERMVNDCVVTLLDEFGESRTGQEASDELIQQLAEAVPKHPDRFGYDVPLAVLEQRVDDLHQVMRDVRYLRQGISLSKSGHKPDDMRSNNASSAESIAITTFRRLASELKSDVADVQRLRPKVEVDLSATQAGLIDLLRGHPDPNEFMNAAIDLGESQTGVAGWEIFRQLPYESEMKDRSTFLIDVVTGNPPGTPVAGFFAEVAYPTRDRKLVADLWLSGSSHYEPDREEWFSNLDYTPAGGKLGSKILASIYRFAYTPGGLGNAADYTLCLAWAAYFARESAQRYVNETGARIGCRAGFSGGDWIELGWFERN